VALNCRTAQTFALNVVNPSQTLGLFNQQQTSQVTGKIKEFSESFPTCLRWTKDRPLSLDDSLGGVKVRDSVNAAVGSLLNRLTPLGWEPTEPTDADRLYKIGRVINKNIKSIFSYYHVELNGVRITFRRWVT
jgi:hypothetical protein